MWPISLPHGISKKTLRMFATSRRILSNIEELLGGMRASFSRTKIYGGGTNDRDTSVKVIPALQWHFECTHLSISTVFLLVTARLKNRESRRIFSSILHPCLFHQPTNKYQQVDSRVHVFRNLCCTKFRRDPAETGVVCSHDTWRWISFCETRKQFTYRFLKLISMVIPVVELLERRVGTCRFP